MDNAGLGRQYISRPAGASSRPGYARRNVRPLAVLRSFSASSGLARLSTLRNSETRERMRLCMYALEHLTGSAL